MRVELVGFSQGVSLHNTDETVNYLDFRRDDGRLFRVPISSEALDNLMTEIYGSPSNGAAMADSAPREGSPAEGPAEDGADVFGGGPEGEFGEAQFPQSEDEIPPL
jgi:hypothetical protein